MWIGLLWYFNLYKIPSMPNIPDEHKPAISKVIAPKALFWFRWAALSTLITGIILGHLNGYLYDALTLDSYNGKNLMIGIGMWLGAIMAFNVWAQFGPIRSELLVLSKFLLKKSNCS